MFVNDYVHKDRRWLVQFQRHIRKCGIVTLVIHDPTGKVSELHMPLSTARQLAHELQQVNELVEARLAGRKLKELSAVIDES